MRGGSGSTRVQVSVDYDFRDRQFEVVAAAWQALARAGYTLVVKDEWSSAEVLGFSVYGPFHRPRVRRVAARRG